MKMSLLLSICLAVAAQSTLADDTPAAPAPGMPSREAMSEVRSACATDVQKLCPGVQPGGGRIVACLKEHKDEVSDPCKQAILKAKQNPAQ
jgi:hypothetical protein